MSVLCSVSDAVIQRDLVSMWIAAVTADWHGWSWKLLESWAQPRIAELVHRKVGWGWTQQIIPPQGTGQAWSMAVSSMTEPQHASSNLTLAEKQDWFLWASSHLSFSSVLLWLGFRGVRICAQLPSQVKAIQLQKCLSTAGHLCFPVLRPSLTALQMIITHRREDFPCRCLLKCTLQLFLIQSFL